MCSCSKTYEYMNTRILLHTRMNECMCKCIYTCTHTHYSHSIIVTDLKKASVAVSFSNSSVRHIIIFSLWTPSQGKQLCFSEGRAPRAEFGFWLNIFFPSLSNILAAGFEMPLQLQIDSSGFLCFYDLSFSIRLKGESREPRSPPGPWKIEIALVEQIICVIFIYSHVT